MRELPPSPSVVEHAQSDRPAPLKELIEHYQTEHALLLKHQEEVERRRAAVRAAAVQEASEILLCARQEIRRVLVQTRRELVELDAQLRAVGYESALGPSLGGDDFQVAVARDIRTVLRDAQSELSDLATDAGNRSATGSGTAIPAPPVVMAALPEPSVAHEFFFNRTQGPSDGTAEDPSEQVPAAGPTAQLAAHWRVATVVLVVVAVVATVIASLRSLPKIEAVTATPEPVAAESAIKVTTPNPNAALATIDASEKPTTTQVSEVRPLTQSVAAGPEPKERPSAMATHGTVAPIPATERPDRAATTPDLAAAAERDILERHQRWFDAFDRGDRATMASLASDNFSIVDERPGRAAVSGRVERTMRDIRVRVTGIGAVLSGQIAETATADEAATVSMLSEVWIRREETWQLVSVRMVPLDAVPKTLQ